MYLNGRGSLLIAIFKGVWNQISSQDRCSFLIATTLLVSIWSAYSYKVVWFYLLCWRGEIIYYFSTFSFNYMTVYSFWCQHLDSNSLTSVRGLVHCVNMSHCLYTILTHFTIVYFSLALRRTRVEIICDHVHSEKIFVFFIYIFKFDYFNFETLCIIFIAYCEFPKTCIYI